MTIWRDRFDVGAIERPLGFHAGAQEVLANAHNRGDGASWFSDRVRTRVGRGAFYLHLVLMRGMHMDVRLSALERKHPGRICEAIAQVKALWSFLLQLYVLPLLGLCAVTLASLQSGVPVREFLADPTSVANSHPFTGVVSSVGVLLWCASAAICLFGWSILQYDNSERKLSNFLCYSGLMTVVLLLDDLFLFHEVIFPHYLGIPEQITIIVYGSLVFYWVIAFKHYILETEYIILLTALTFFWLSLLIDVFQYRIEPFLGDWRILLEDGFKLLGIVGWCGYLSRCFFFEIRRIAHLRRSI
ncbi:MAG: hypothetical protein MN733_00925 [Nitrososphaera sp.]|nr:hypothetical protein [Nitrososphaera sp.]